MGRPGSILHAREQHIDGLINGRSKGSLGQPAQARIESQLTPSGVSSQPSPSHSALAWETVTADVFLRLLGATAAPFLSRATSMA